VNEDFRDLLAALLEAGARFCGAGLGRSPALRRAGGGDGRPPRILGRAALVRNKRATGRAKDRADLEALGEEG
jgi:hypothetical protein